MAMVPGTVKDLEHIVDLKDAKDTWKVPETSYMTAWISWQLLWRA